MLRTNNNGFGAGQFINKWILRIRFQTTASKLCCGVLDFDIFLLYQLPVFLISSKNFT
jgi:hypothetical protein